ncbi:heme-binding protein [Methylocystis sp. IM3]|uniref:SOUL family heme-binding protein n=1 Tax=unclassified Methylocystis TaxID=2625913 RepID=UPI0030F8781D
MRRLSMVLVGLLATAPASADSDVEHARYSVVASAGDFEIRDYAPQIVAETTVAGERDAAIKEGFRRLAGYIFGDNAGAGKIAMTAPVEQQPQGQKIAMTAPVAQARAGDAWVVRFTMPAELTMASLPKPNNAAVRLAQAPGKRIAALRFSGLAGDDDLAANEAKLVEELNIRGLGAKGPAVYAFYDPPWTLPWNRRNEILVEVDHK